jgi:hypothetical protein
VIRLISAALSSFVHSFLTQCFRIMYSRYGKRTFQGLVQDGFNALARYYYNNFTDGIKQVI